MHAGRVARNVEMTGGTAERGGKPATMAAAVTTVPRLRMPTSHHDVQRRCRPRPLGCTAALHGFAISLTREGWSSLDYESATIDWLTEREELWGLLYYYSESESARVISD
eukprot:scaffold3146_cov98-Isochrysis_galbana.AAC.8